MPAALIERGRALYAKFEAAASQLQAPLLLAIRLYWGWQFFLAGKGKLMNLEKTTHFFDSLGIPAPGVNAIMAASTECFGGLLLLIGLGGRLVAVPLTVTMCVAYATAHRDSLKTIFSDPDNFISQPPFLFLFASLIVLAFGPGALSADALVVPRLLPKKKSEKGD